MNHSAKTTEFTEADANAVLASSVEVDPLVKIS
jgi:hypothetical protein